MIRRLLRSRRPAAPLCAAPLLALAAVAAPTQEPSPPPGWSLVLEGGGAQLVGHAEAAAFALEAGQTRHPALPTDAPFTAAHEGLLSLQESGRYRFGLDVEGGRATLVVHGEAGEELARLESRQAGRHFGSWLELGADDLRLTVRFEGAGGRAARLRTLWEMDFEGPKGFRLEPVPTRRVAVPADRVADVAAGRRVERGARLLETKGCTACHASEALGVRIAPDLERVGERAGEAWLRRWLRDPAAVRPGADMPHLPLVNDTFAGLFAGMLASFREPGGDATTAPSSEPVDGEGAESSAPTDPAEGRDLYHGVGCVACHGALASPAELLDDPFFPDAVPDASVPAPLGEQRGKWTAEDLAAFLLDPALAWPDGRMPSLSLTDREARAIGDYLVAELGPRPAPTEPPADEARQSRGQGLLANAGCLGCHALGDAPRTPPEATPLAALDPLRGCLDPADARTPRYDLTEEEREDLRLALEHVPAWSDADAPVHRARALLDANACGACHARHGAGGPDEALRVYFASEGDEVDLGDEGRIPPDLGGTGTKLTTTWTRKMLTGEGEARPYLATRMPVFGLDAAGLAADLAGVDGVRPHTDAPWPEVDDLRVQTGHALLGRSALGCTACHVYADYPPTGTVGLDMTQFTERLRYEWYAAFLPDPARYEPGTRMPAFGRGRRSTLRDVYGGDLHAQADAMWSAFSLGEFMPLPEGVEREAKIPVEVSERPVVIRTFLEEVGPRAVAVGHPEGIHLAFDASACRLASIWRGAFLDAAGAWAGRGGTNAGGRSAPVWSLEGREPRDGVSFRGYRLLADGRPRFEYELGGALVAESYDPDLVPEPHLLRELVVEGAPPGGVPIEPGEGTRLVAVEGGELRAADGAVLALGAALPADVLVVGSGTVRVTLEVSL